MTVGFTQRVRKVWDVFGYLMTVLTNTKPTSGMWSHP